MAKKSSQAGTRPGAGRPPYRPTLSDRQTVEQMKFCGDAETVIARAIGISVPTLQKHFADELENGHAHRRKEVLDLLFKCARDGNATAIKRLEEMGRVAGAAAAVEDRGRRTAEPKLGKKEEQQLAAERVGGKYATPPGPKLVVSNA